MKILRVQIFVNFVDWPQSAKISPRRKKSPQNIKPQKLTPFSQIKNSAFLAELMFFCAEAKLLCRCQELVTKNLSGLFGNPKIANKSLLVTFMTESESEDEECNLTNGSQNEWRTGSNRVASHSCSSGASAAACTDVVSVLKTSLNWTRKCCYYWLSLPNCVTVGHSFAF